MKVEAGIVLALDDACAALDRFQNIVMVEGDDADIAAELVEMPWRVEKLDA